MIECYKCEYYDKRMGIDWCCLGFKLNKEEGTCIFHIPTGTFAPHLWRLNFDE